jgi:hypothetical protein
VESVLGSLFPSFPSVRSFVCAVLARLQPEFATSSTRTYHDYSGTARRCSLDKGDSMQRPRSLAADTAEAVGIHGQADVGLAGLVAIPNPGGAIRRSTTPLPARPAFRPAWDRADSPWGCRGSVWERRNRCTIPRRSRPCQKGPRHSACVRQASAWRQCPKGRLGGQSAYFAGFLRVLGQRELRWPAVRQFPGQVRSTAPAQAAQCGGEGTGPCDAGGDGRH